MSNTFPGVPAGAANVYADDLVTNSNFVSKISQLSQLQTTLSNYQATLTTEQAYVITLTNQISQTQTQINTITSNLETFISNQLQQSVNY